MNAGLEPFAGFLHVDRSGKPSLVLDLMEEFRQPVVDRPIFSWLNKGGQLTLQKGMLERRGVQGECCVPCAMMRLVAEEHFLYLLLTCRGKQHQVRSRLSRCVGPLGRKPAPMRGSRPYLIILLQIGENCGAQESIYPACCGNRCSIWGQGGSRGVIGSAPLRYRGGPAPPARIADVCIDYGLERRIQFSAFFGKPESEIGVSQELAPEVAERTG